MHSEKRLVRYCDLGRTRYTEVWGLQRAIHAEVARGCCGDIFIVNEHEHVYTLGRGGDANHLLAGEDDLRTLNAEFVETDRGGDITYHGPGQVVGYPILNLENFRKDIHWYLRQLEELIIRSLDHYGIKGNRSEGETGVWVKNEKIAAIGIKVSRWVTMHGFALNVSPDLRYFGRIIPCGIFHKGVTSMERVLQAKISMRDVVSTILKEFERVFHVSLEEIKTSHLNEMLTQKAV